MSVALPPSVSTHRAAAPGADASSSDGVSAGKGAAFGAEMAKQAANKTAASATTHTSGQGHAHLHSQEKSQDGTATTDTSAKTDTAATVQDSSAATATAQDSTSTPAADTTTPTADSLQAAQAQTDPVLVDPTQTATSVANGTTAAHTAQAVTPDAAALAAAASVQSSIMAATATAANAGTATPAAANPGPAPAGASTPKAPILKADAARAGSGKTTGFADALGAVKDAGNVGAGADTNANTQVASQDPLKDMPKPAATDAKDAVNRVRSSLDIFTQQPQATQAQAADTQAQAPVQSDATTAAPAFSLQALTDTQGSYNATGASTTAASNMSRVATETLSAMSVQMSKKLSEGNTKFTMELHPADLGKVQVTLSIGHDGKTTAHLQFDSAVTASAFQSHEGELRDQLAQTGLSFDKDALTFSSRGDSDASSGSAFAQQQQDSQQQQSQQARQAARAMQAAGQMAEDADIGALDASLASFRNRPSSSTLALNLIV